MVRGFTDEVFKITDSFLIGCSGLDSSCSEGGGGASESCSWRQRKISTTDLSC